MKKSFMKRLVALALVIVSVFAVSSTAFAATTYVDVGWATAYLTHETDYAPCIYSSMSRSSTILTRLDDVTYVDIKMNTNNPNWVRCRYNGIEGYLPLFQCEFTKAQFYKACFGGYGLQRGFKGQPVSNLQMYLKMVFDSSLSIDGDFGSKTEDAVLAFQEANSLVNDGIAGANTAYALWQEVAPRLSMQ